MIIFFASHLVFKVCALKVCMIDYTNVNKESACKYWMVDSKWNKSCSQNSNEYAIFR